MSMRTVDVVVPSYNGSALLRTCLSAIRQLTNARVFVVDDASTDDSVAMLAREFPDVRVIARAYNGGFGAAANDGIRAGDSEFVMLLNTDVEAPPNVLDPILPLFDDETAFAVSPRIVTPSLGGIDDGAKTAVWHRGMLWVDNVQEVRDIKPVFFASGCASVYRRSMLEALGGFDEAYSPFYWEDVDLSYRAWKRGWKSLYQPASSVIHQHSATVSKIRGSHTDSIKSRNGFFFLWRNIEDEVLLRQHRRWLPLVLIRRVVARDWAFVKGWRLAYARRAEALAARQRDSAHRVLTDREILTRTTKQLC